MRIALPLMAIMTWLPFTDCLSAQETAGIPQTVIDDWSYFIGDWKVEGQAGRTRVMGTATFKWTKGKQSYFGEQDWKLGQTETVIHLSLLGGWDSEKNQTIEQGFDSTGGLATVRYEIQSGDDYPASKSGSIVGYSRRGGSWAGRTKIERMGPDKFLLTTNVDGNRFHELTFQRQTTHSEK